VRLWPRVEFFRALPRTTANKYSTTIHCYDWFAPETRVPAKNLTLSMGAGQVISQIPATRQLPPLPVAKSSLNEHRIFPLHFDKRAVILPM
jgi:hypothetical protein